MKNRLDDIIKMSPSPFYIDVAVALPARGVFTYEAPGPLAPLSQAGKRVRVPFGARTADGYILGPARKEGLENIKKIKPILDIPDDFPLFPASMLPFFEWVSDYYMRPLGEVIKNALPGGWIDSRGRAKKGRPGPGMERWAALAENRPAGEKFRESKQHILDALSRRGEMSVKQLKEIVKTAPALIRSLEKDGHVRIFQKRIFRDPLGDDVPADFRPDMTREQEEAVARIMSRAGSGFAPHLLTGVTGSGKTEVYMRLAEKIVGMGKNALVLVPEIALLSQTERVFKARFREKIAVLHSGLSPARRREEWTRIAKGEASVAIGARSAVFAPFERVGIIIVDEEHDPSYKQDSGLKYHGRDMALVRAKLENAPAVLGSATPSVQSHHHMIEKKYADVRLPRRIFDRPLPDISIVDLRKIKDERGIRRFISPDLKKALSETLEKKNQALLFLNRRGFAGFPVCGACDEPVKCRRCDITLTLHRAEAVYRCHYCGFSIPASSPCRLCGSPEIKNLGIGTEKLEAAVQSLFPTARVSRMDRDAARKKGALPAILKSLRNHETDILIGTQMVAKGHDFPGITLVGIICADLSLNFPDFRAGEATFQLISQVAGRAGRGESPGRVILQTYTPGHFTIRAAKKGDYPAFYQKETEFRKALDYPPFSKMILIEISGRDPEKTAAAAREAGLFLHQLRRGDPAFRRSVMLLGPAKAPVFRIAHRLRWQVLVKSPDGRALRAFGRQAVSAPAMKNRHVRVSFDVDPVFMM
ncbi:Primosomal protein N' [Candidatus Desulfarcum epimagneticum]|uniref:Replication restart protein PriA n=1 Tax=uncultured Desulfobacteraceae bacterium TaxID=218296 RepID=A0A484HG70_9BACT|nr:Primosomal protein N' [uncultured Desulfobacteraceae bacterium]